MKPLLNGMCFVAGFLVATVLIGSLMPFPAVPEVGPKYRLLKEHRADVDTIFVGSSRIYHQIDPQQFDTEVAALGGSARSLNLAYDSLWPPESFYFTRCLLALRPPKLRWVFIELMALHPEIEARNDRTMRTAYWHDWRHTRIVWRSIFGSSESWAEKLRLATGHAAIFLRWNVNFGRGSEILPTIKQERPAKWINRAGFLPENDRSISGDDLPRFLGTVAQLRASLPFHPVSPVYREALDDLVAEVRRAGAQPVFVLTPSLDWHENMTGLPAGIPIFSFNDPGKYPTLYEADRHYDAWHLNEKGAAEFTSLLARRFAEYLRPR